MFRGILSRFHNIFSNTMLWMSFAYNRLSKNHNYINWAIQLFTSIAQELHSQITMNERTNTTQIFQFQLAIIAHRTTQVIHQLINTIILNWVGGSDLSTHDTLCWQKQLKGKRLSTQSHGLNATNYRPDQSWAKPPTPLL